MTITTKKGDKGRSCWGGIEAGKDGRLLGVIGGIDELNAVFQLIGVRFGGGEWDDLVTDLGKIMGVLACGGEYGLEERIGVMEKEIKKGEGEMDKIDGFVSFKTEKGAMINWARAMSRKVEREVVLQSRIGILQSGRKRRRVGKDMLVYFNRLSDYLFILARKAE